MSAREAIHSKLLVIDRKIEHYTTEGNVEKSKEVKRRRKVLEHLEQKAEEKLSTSAIAEAIEAGYDFITPENTRVLHWYNGGSYKSNGDLIVEQMVKIADEDITRHRTQEVIHHIKTQSYLDEGLLNANLNLIPLRNGVYAFEEGSLLEHSSEHYFTFQLPINYVEGADCPNFRKFLKEVLYEKDITALQEFFGFCLLRRYDFQKAFMLCGEGSNGKSVFLSILRIFLGNVNTSSVSLHDLLRNRFAKANLYGKLVNIHSDIPKDALRETGIFKELTGGDQGIAEKKFGQPFNFINHAKLIFSTNQVPEVKDDTDAFFRRWVLISFPYKFTETGEGGTKVADANLLPKLITDAELSGIFNWAIEGLERLRSQGKFSDSTTVEQTREKYRKMSNSLAAYVQDSLMADPDGEIGKDTFYNAYCGYCRGNALEPKKKETVGKEIGRHINAVGRRGGKRGNRVVVWKGIRFKVETNPDTTDSVSRFENPTLTQSGEGRL